MTTTNGLVSLAALLLLLQSSSAYLFYQDPVCGGSYMNSLRYNPQAFHQNSGGDGCGGSYMKSVGALTNGSIVPLAKETGKTTRSRGCGGTYMNSVGAFPEQYVPLAKDMVDPRNSPDTVVYQKITPLLDRYNQQYQAKISKQQEKTWPFPAAC